MAKSIWQIIVFCLFCLFVFFWAITRSSHLTEIRRCLYAKFPENVEIYSLGLNWFVHIPFGSMIKFQLLTLLLLVVVVVFYIFACSSHQRWQMVFQWTLIDSKSPQVSRTLLNILANLNNTVVWMVSTHPLISISSSSWTSPLGTVPKAPVKIGIIVILMFHIFFNSLAWSRYLYLILISFSFTQWSAGTAKFIIWVVLFCELGLVVWLRLDDPFGSQNPKEYRIYTLMFLNDRWGTCGAKHSRFTCSRNKCSWASEN